MAERVIYRRAFVRDSIVWLGGSVCVCAAACVLPVRGQGIMSRRFADGEDGVRIHVQSHRSTHLVCAVNSCQSSIASIKIPTSGFSFSTGGFNTFGVFVTHGLSV